jgi:ubiquinone/menaquinone biosynthesis C-methylase UbiE
MKQKDNFLNFEGNNYYERNKSKLVAQDKVVAHDPILLAIEQMVLKPQSVLEIGCSNGWRLETVRRLYQAECFGVDPSQAAILDGAAMFPDLRLEKGTADKLPFADDLFDLVVFGFCLYLCDRGDLFRIASEADRVLEDTGHLVIFDFYPPFPYRNSYQHLPGLSSYKLDYASMFTWNPAYTLVWRSVFTHSGLTRIDEPNERLSVAILQKNSQRAYLDNPFLA